MTQNRPLPTGVPPGPTPRPVEPVPAWRRWIKLALLALGLVVAAFSAGRFSAPEQVRERIEYRSLAVEDITAGFKWGKASTRTRTVKRDVVTTITDAGTTIVDKTIEREGEGATENAEATEKIARTESTEKIAEKITTLRPDWRIGVQIGASLRAPALHITGPLVLGASVERRIVGGVSLGLWANTVGAGGASVSVEF